MTIRVMKGIEPLQRYSMMTSQLLFFATEVTGKLAAFLGDFSALAALSTKAICELQLRLPIRCHEFLVYDLHVFKFYHIFSHLSLVLH